MSINESHYNTMNSFFLVCELKMWVFYLYLFVVIQGTYYCGVSLPVISASNNRKIPHTYLA